MGSGLGESQETQPMKKTAVARRRVTVFIADASMMECQLMTKALEESPQQIRVVGSATDSAAVLTELGENSPDVAIISADLRDGPIVGFQVAREARVSNPHVRIIALLDSPEPATVVEGFRAGADGIFSRDEPFEMLCKCIRAVHEGQIWASSRQLHFVIEALVKSGPPRIKSASGANLLTKREEGLVHCVADGLTNKDIARQLKLSEHTVRNYLFRIFNKLGTSNRLELALYAIKQREASEVSDFSSMSLAEPVPGSSNGRSFRVTRSPVSCRAV
jgi:DNA-binding NarL/FixJ family response regulator